MMTSSSCLLSDLNGAADAVLKVDAGDISPCTSQLPPNKSDIPSTECSTPPDDNGKNVSDRNLIFPFISIFTISTT